MARANTKVVTLTVVVRSAGLPAEDVMERLEQHVQNIEDADPELRAAVLESTVRAYRPADLKDLPADFLSRPLGGE